MRVTLLCFIFDGKAFKVSLLRTSKICVGILLRPTVLKELRGRMIYFTTGLIKQRDALNC